MDGWKEERKDEILPSSSVSGNILFHRARENEIKHMEANSFECLKSGAEFGLINLRDNTVLLSLPKPHFLPLGNPTVSSRWSLGRESMLDR